MRLNVLLFILFIVLCGYTESQAFRSPRPPTLKIPLTEEQVSQLNKYLEDVENITNGRYEMDVVTTAKTKLKNGEMYILQTGTNSTIVYKSGGYQYNLTP